MARLHRYLACHSPAFQLPASISYFLIKNALCLIQLPTESYSYSYLSFSTRSPSRNAETSEKSPRSLRCVTLTDVGVARMQSHCLKFGEVILVNAPLRANSYLYLVS